MGVELSNDDRRELLRKADTYANQGNRTGDAAMLEFAEALRCFAWTGGDPDSGSAARRKSSATSEEGAA